MLKVRVFFYQLNRVTLRKTVGQRRKKLDEKTRGKKLDKTRQKRSKIHVVSTFFWIHEVPNCVIEILASTVTRNQC